MAAWTHNIEPYQGLIKVPLLISGAGMQGVHSERFRLVDLAPTLLDLLGIPYEKTDFDGCSLRSDGDRRVIYADSANYCELGGLSFHKDSAKLICSRRLGSVAYPVLDNGYENITTRYRSPELVDGLRHFLSQYTRVTDRDGAVDHERILIDRLRGLGYL